MTITKRQIEHECIDKDLELFSVKLTPYAFKFVKEQFQQVGKVNIISQNGQGAFKLTASKTGANLEPHNVTSKECDCSVFTRMFLPCKHILKARKILSLPLFDESLVHKRWTMNYYQTETRLRLIAPLQSDYAIGETVTAVARESKPTTMTQSHKFRKALVAAQVLAALASEGGMSTFRQRYHVLENILGNWKHDKEVFVRGVLEEEGSKYWKKDTKKKKMDGSRSPK